MIRARRYGTWLRVEEFERVARAAVAEAGAHLRANWKAPRTIQHKGEVDLVTETDQQLEALILDRLRHAFPEHVVIAEEATAGRRLERPRAGGPVWYLDPLDGTTNFAHAYPHVGISLALGQGTDIVFAIVQDPIRDETFVAHRGGGATLNGEPISVSTVDNLDQSLLATGFPYDRRVHFEFYIGFFADFLQRAQGTRRNGSAALDLCYVASGRLDGFWEWKLQPWDVAAGALIVREAGGVVTDFTGGEFDLFGQQTLASNGRIHAAMVATLSARLPMSTGSPARLP